MPTPIQKRLIPLCLTVGLCLGSAMAQGNQAPANTKVDVVKLKLNDGSFMTVDDAWETSQGIWYRQGGLSHLVSKERVKSIERGTPQTNTTEQQTVAAVAPRQREDGPAWIYLVGGARVEADSATESSAGVWYRRGPLSIFLEKSRVERVEREDPDTIAAAPKERGWSTGSSKLDSLIKQNGNKHGVDPYLVFLVMEQESHFNSRAVSPKGARGLMQLMPGTAARFGVRRPHDPAQNISGGTRYLRQLLDRFNNRVDLVLASYNAGEGAVIKFGHKVPPYRETRNYVKQISYRYKRSVTRPKSPAPSAGNPTSPGER